MHAGFEQFKAFDQDAIDNKAFVAKGKLRVPVLEEGIVPTSGHWVMEETPGATIALLTAFLAK